MTGRVEKERRFLLSDADRTGDPRYDQTIAKHACICDRILSLSELPVQKVTNLIIHLSQKHKRREASQEEAADNLSTSEENPNLSKNITNREGSTEISIEQVNARIYPQLGLHEVRTQNARESERRNNRKEEPIPAPRRTLAPPQLALAAPQLTLATPQHSCAPIFSDMNGFRTIIDFWPNIINGVKLCIEKEGKLKGKRGKRRKEKEKRCGRKHNLNQWIIINSSKDAISNGNQFVIIFISAKHIKAFKMER
ncbi:hypothetical protein G5I_02361 [Acromyrmex echinatior]|uniref:Uncharacterized protein n=1 Tax=Acromyrmex echinatior TaxID=103372 RepID=F4WA45_ACREC|nr:hypothetical protein G5I_02361 [Acromyrmex echinatior]